MRRNQFTLDISGRTQYLKPPSASFPQISSWGDSGHFHALDGEDDLKEDRRSVFDQIIGITFPAG